MGARTRARGLAIADRARRIPGANLVLRIIRDLAVNDLTDRAMTLAAQAFTSVLPIVILLTALPNHTYLTKALDGLGVDPGRVDPGRVDIASTSTPQSLTAFGILGALMTIGGATSLSRALGRMYVSVWEVNKLPISGWWRWVVVIFAIPLGVVAQGLAASLHGISFTDVTIDGYGALGVTLEIVATFLIWSIMWATLPRLLVSSQVPMRLLALNGAVTGIFVTVLMVGSRLALPTIMGETTNHYGTLGMVFVAISWLFFFAGIVVVCAVVIHSLVSDEGTVGTWMRAHVGAPRPSRRVQRDNAFTLAPTSPTTRPDRSFSPLAFHPPAPHPSNSPRGPPNSRSAPIRARRPARSPARRAASE
nr:YhjD/YihY/BrkB family envelope integrity protein [Gordonia sp. SID5947]